MPNFQEVGFLGEELVEFRKNIRAAHETGFHCMEQANAVAMNIIWKIPLENLTSEMAAAIACYARALGAFQGMVLMAERGAIAEARTLLRALAETMFLALGIFEKPDMLALLEEDDAAHRKGIANALCQMHIARNTGADLSKFQEVVKEITEKYGEKPRSIKWASLAAEVGVESVYQVAYRFISGDAAHATLQSLNRHLQTNKDGGKHQFILGPTDDDLDKTFRGALASMLKLMELAVTKMGAKELEPAVQNLNLELLLYFKGA
jgi:hypothetical protein